MTEIRIEPHDFPGASQIEAAAQAALLHLDLRTLLVELALVIDAPEFEGGGFWSLERDADEAVRATLYGSPRDLLRPGDRMEDPNRVVDLSLLSGLGAERLDRLRVDRWLHRNLLQLDDLLSGRVEPKRVPHERSAGLQAVWDVWTDGRLRARQQPGFTQAERRRIFFRVFAERGLLLPRHWEIYHRLWDGKYEDLDSLLLALESLPQVR